MSSFWLIVSVVEIESDNVERVIQVNGIGRAMETRDKLEKEYDMSIYEVNIHPC